MSNDIRKGLERAAKWHDEQVLILNKIGAEARDRGSHGHANMANTIAEIHKSSAVSIREMARSELDRWIDRRIDAEKMEAAYDMLDEGE